MLKKILIVSVLAGAALTSQAQACVPGVTFPHLTFPSDTGDGFDKPADNSKKSNG